MPAYEFKCAKCGNVFTKLLKMTQRDHPTVCAREFCSGVAERIYSPANVWSPTRNQSV